MNLLPILAFVIAERGPIAVALAILALLILAGLAVLLPTAHARAVPALLLLVGSLVAGLVAGKSAI